MAGRGRAANCGLRLSPSQAHCGTLVSGPERCRRKCTRIYRAAVNHSLSSLLPPTTHLPPPPAPIRSSSASDNSKQTLTFTRRLHRVVPCSGPSQLLQLAVRYPRRIGPHTTPPPPPPAIQYLQAPDSFRYFFTCSRSAPSKYSPDTSTEPPAISSPEQMPPSSADK